jgi:hypothetical protein
MQAAIKGNKHGNGDGNGQVVHSTLNMDGSGDFISRAVTVAASNRQAHRIPLVAFIYSYPLYYPLSQWARHNCAFEKTKGGN